MEISVGNLQTGTCYCGRSWKRFKVPAAHNSHTLTTSRGPIQWRAWRANSRIQASLMRRTIRRMRICRASSAENMDNNEFDSVTGLPVVRDYLNYGELLSDIRMGHVKEIHWFREREDTVLQGPCLVEYKDGKVKQSYVANVDMRIPQAMQAHGVKGSVLEPVPTSAELNPFKPPSEWLMDSVTKILPLISLVLVYISVQYMAWKKGDMDDRKKIRQKQRDAADMLKKDLMTEAQEAEAENLASMGWSAEEIMQELDLREVDYTEEYVLNLVAGAKEREASGSDRREGVFVSEDEAKKSLETKDERQKARQNSMEAEDDAQRVDKMLSMSTMKVKGAKTPEELEKRDKQRKMRELERKMKTRGMKLQYAEEDEVFFDDVAGIGNSKFEVMEVVDFFMNPERFRLSGAQIPRGVLLCGPPGCGKTMLARAVAGEAGASFLSVNASEFVEMFIGVGASRVRDLFQEARRNAPSIVFIDEIDAVGRVRGGAMGNDERDQTVNQLLSELDGFSNKDADVVVMAATNRRDVLDPALIRAGRFDRIVYVDLPDFNGRIEILQVYLNKRPTSDDIDLREIAFETQRFSGAALANLVNVSAMLAGRKGKDEISHQDIADALDYERLGPTRQPYSDSRQQRLAVHEAATCLVSTLMPAIEPVVYSTILPREKYPMGQTVLKVNEQRELTQLFTQRYLEEQLMVVLAPRAAEDLAYGLEEMSSINQRRLVIARRIVQKMVVSGNMEVVDGIGHQALSSPWRHGRQTLQIIPGRVTARTYQLADRAMDRKLNENYEKVKVLIDRNWDAFKALEAALLKENTLQGAVIRSIVEKYGSKRDLAVRREFMAEEFL